MGRKQTPAQAGRRYLWGKLSDAGRESGLKDNEGSSLNKSEGQEGNHRVGREPMPAERAAQDNEGKQGNHSTARA